MAKSSKVSERLNKILAAGHLAKVEKGQVIRTSEKNSQFYLLAKGYAMRYLITNDGNIDVQSIYGPGYFFPLITVYRGLFDQEIYKGPETYYYEALTDCEMHHVDIEKVAEAAKKDLLIYKELLVIAGQRLEANIQQIENRALKTFYNRVAHQIAFYGDVFSEHKGKQAKLKIPLTQQILADVLSTTRETVSLCMSDLKKRGIIKAGKFITITNLDKLKEEAFS
ncbi:MAG: Crp/Fnr family transcriptional regulator [Candidatus Saccharimonadales bacterium]